MRTLLASTMNWAAIALLFASVIPYLAPPKKFSELLSHFKAQYCLASMFCLFLSGIPKNYLSVACAAFALAINSSGMMSFYYSGRRKRVGRQPLKIALIN